MTDYIKYGLIAAAVGLVYLVGYKHAESEGEAMLEGVKNSHALAIIEAQEKEKAKYEETIKSLTRDLDAVRSDRDRRVLELKNFRESGADNETCRRQRDRLATIAVGLEDVANRAVVLIKSTQQ